MAFTMTVHEDQTILFDSDYLGIQKGVSSIVVVLPAAFKTNGYMGYVDFSLPDGSAYYIGPLDYSTTGNFAFSLGSFDNLLDLDGKVLYQVVLGTSNGNSRINNWQSKQYETKILPAINASISASK